MSEINISLSAPAPGQNRKIIFNGRPDGAPSASTFSIQSVEMPSLREGDILCRNLYLSVDPYLRLKMHDRESYTPPLRIGQTVPGRNVAVVVDSAVAGWRRGDLAVISGGWQDYVSVPAKFAQRVDPAIAPETAWLGALGMTGLTAYAGLLEIGKPLAGETVIVSAAGGAVGSLVGQIAKIKGCRVVGIAGTREKCDFVTGTLGFDACIDYKQEGWEAALREACTDGCDIYFDNVGGSVSAGVMPLLNVFARVAVCGLISQYSGQHASAPTALDEWMRWILVRRLTVRGFIVTDLEPAYPEFTATMATWLREGRIVVREHMHQGFEKVVPAFLGMLAGENIGKSIVRIAKRDHGSAL